MNRFQPRFDVSSLRKKLGEFLVKGTALYPEMVMLS